MSSLMCVRTPSGTVQIYDQEQAEELTVDVDTADLMPRHRSRIKPKKLSRVSAPSIESPEPSSVTMSRVLKNWDRRSECLWLSKKQVEDLQKESRNDPSSFHWICTPLLDTEKTFVKDVKSYLDHKDMLDLRKKELLHKNWTNRVFEPIREKIVGAMNSDDWPDKDRRRRELHRQYLEHINKKGHVFLDTMDEGEYYAQALNHSRPSSITVHTNSLQDPLLAQERQRNKEDQMVLHCLTGQLYSHSDIDQVRLPPLPLVPLGRHGTDSVSWLEMPLGNIESTPRRASRAKSSLLGKQVE